MVARYYSVCQQGSPRQGARHFPAGTTLHSAKCATGGLWEVANAWTAEPDCARERFAPDVQADGVRDRTREFPTAEVQAEVKHDLALGQLIYDLRTGAGLSQRELAERMGTTQSVISRLEEGGRAKNRLETLARVAEALGRNLIVSFPEKVPAKLKDAVQVA